MDYFTVVLLEYLYVPSLDDLCLSYYISLIHVHNSVLT